MNTRDQIWWKFRNRFWVWSFRYVLPHTYYYVYGDVSK